MDTRSDADRETLLVDEEKEMHERMRHAMMVTLRLVIAYRMVAYCWKATELNSCWHMVRPR